MAVVTVGSRVELEEPRETREDVEDGGVAIFEHCAPLGGNGLGVVEILVEKQTRVTGIHAVDVMHVNPLFCISGVLPPEERSRRELRHRSRES
jgi:hypothetical protein